MEIGWQNFSTGGLVGVAILGLLIGSFLNVVIYRLPLMLKEQYRRECQAWLANAPEMEEYPKFNLLVPRSRCPHCQVPIAWWHNLPLVSYLILRGRCAKCHAAISPRYPFVELLGMVVAMAVFGCWGMVPVTLPLLVLSWSLLAMIFIDGDQQLLPDCLTLPMLWLGLLVNSAGWITTPTAAIIGACCGYLSLWIVATLFKWIRGIDGMGAGDFKLLALWGAWLGWQSLPTILLLAALSGLAYGVGRRIICHGSWHQPIPFGPWLGMAGWVVALGLYSPQSEVFVGSLRSQPTERTFQVYRQSAGASHNVKNLSALS